MTRQAAAAVARVTATELDAVVVGAGPNGLAAAIAVARAGKSVGVFELGDTVGGGSRSAELTLPGFTHDICSAIHPLARASPFFSELPLERHGLTWIEPPVQIAHPFDDGSAAFVYRSVDDTAAGLGADGRRYARLIRPLARDFDLIVRSLFGPLRPLVGLRHPIALARFGVPSVLPARLLTRLFRTDAARVLLAGCAAHASLRLGEPMSGGFGLALLTSAHAVGWPMPRGGSQRIADALAAHLTEDLGGTITTGQRVTTLDELPAHRAALLDLSPRGVLQVSGGRLRGWYARQLRTYRYGPAAFKLDIAIEGEIGWRNPDVGLASTVHLAGTLGELAASENAVRRGEVPERPFVLVSQQSRFDPTRAPNGRNTVWAYCHVPNGATADMTDRILGQIERFAPGFRERILAVHASSPAELEAYNPNYVGGDILGGLQDLGQFFTRPAVRWDPYSTPDPRIFICSASTPPGGGVHGLCGLYAARSALRRALR